MELPAGCTGLSASWCHNCGDCCCCREESLDHPDCPLHGSGSHHAEIDECLDKIAGPQMFSDVWAAEYIDPSLR